MTDSDAITPVLTPKQRRFVEEYLLDMNATKAAIRAGYSKQTANQQGPRLLENQDVRNAIDASKAKRSEKLEVDSEYVLRRLVEECEADLADLYTDVGDLKPIEDWPEVWRRGLVAGVEVEALFEGHGEQRKQIGYVKRVRLSDRLRRLELIGKHIRVNAFQETVQHKGLDALAERLERAHERASDVSAAPPAREPSRDVPQEAAPPPPSASSPYAPPSPPPAPKPRQPIMPLPESAPWPTYGGTSKADYEPLTD